MTYDDDKWRRHRLGQIEEHGRYVSVEQIWHDGVLAYDAGGPVPASNVARHGYDKAGLVRETDEYVKLAAMLAPKVEPAPRVKKSEAAGDGN